MSCRFLGVFNVLMLIFHIPSVLYYCGGLHTSPFMIFCSSFLQEESDVRTFFFPVIIFVFKFFYYALVMQLLRSYTHRMRGNLQRCRTGKAMV